MSICYSGSPSLCLPLIVIIQFVILHSWLNWLIDWLYIHRLLSRDVGLQSSSRYSVPKENSNCGKCKVQSVKWTTTHHRPKSPYQDCAGGRPNWKWINQYNLATDCAILSKFDMRVHCIGSLETRDYSPERLAGWTASSGNASLIATFSTGCGVKLAP